MKATIEFNLADKDERMANLRCLKSLDMAIVLFEIHHNLYKRLEVEGADKYNDGVLAVIDRIDSLLEEHNINLDELIL